MITSDAQYRRTKELVAEFALRLDVLEATVAEAERPMLRAIEIAAVRSQLDTLRRELVAYDATRRPLADGV